MSAGKHDGCANFEIGYSIAEHNFSRIQSLIAYVSIHHFDICLSEKYLNYDISSDNENLDMPGYRLLWSDQPSNKRGCLHLHLS